ncbi:MAG: zf-HC2 domain-containing protein [Anaerocolumna sp.]
MNCIDIQRLIVPFINDELNIEQLEEFIHHVHSCPNCMEELEVYYVLLAGMKQLDEDKELSDDFNQDLRDLISLSEDRIIHNKFLHIRKRIVLIILITLVAVISSLRIGEFVVEDVLNNDKKSDFLMDNVFLVDSPAQFDNQEIRNVNDSLSGMILNNLADIYIYLKTNDPEGAKLMEEKFGDRIWMDTNVSKSVGMEFDIDDWIVLNY